MSSLICLANATLGKLNVIALSLVKSRIDVLFIVFPVFAFVTIGRVVFLSGKSLMFT